MDRRIGGTLGFGRLIAERLDSWRPRKAEEGDIPEPEEVPASRRSGLQGAGKTLRENFEESLKKSEILP